MRGRRPAATPWVRPVTLTGRRIRLEPLDDRHLAGLVAAAAADPSTWAWMHAPLTDETVLRAWLDDALAARAAGRDMPFAVVDVLSGRLLGSTRFMAIAPAHRRLEIGWTWLGPGARGSGANAEAKLLLLEHAFERLEAMRVEFKTDALNARSRAALEGIGARFEGISRRHMLMADGRVRDSAWYAIVADDWPTVRDRLQARVAARAGDEEGS